MIANPISNECDAEAEQPGAVNEPRLWIGSGWTARVIKNEDGEGWAVEMIKDGEAEPALVGPWTMGRDKKNPKPLDVSAFNTLVKTASEVLRRHEQQLHALYHKTITVDAQSGRVKVTLARYPELDHLFVHEDGESSPERYLADGRQVDAEFLADLETWLSGKLGDPG